MDQKSKILYLHAGAELYGADKILLELVSLLDKKMFTPIVVLPEEGRLCDKLKKNGVEVHIIPYPILRRKYFTPKGVIQYVINYRKYSKELVSFCNKNDINIVHVNTSAVLEGCYIKKKLGLPTVWHIHEILTRPRSVVKFIFKRIAKNSDKIVCVSKATADNFVRITGVSNNKIEVIYNGVDNSIYNPNNETSYLKREFCIKESDIVVGMIGRINAWKGQSDFVKSMDEVFDINMNKKSIKAVIVGGVYSGQEWRIDELKRQINNSKYKDNFILSDFRSDAPNIHNLFDIFVLPSVEPDPLPTVVLESMATGKPVIGYKHGGVCEMVANKKSGILVEVGNTQDLANSISFLINNSRERKSFGKNGLNRQKTMFSIDNFITKFEQIYSKVGK